MGSHGGAVIMARHVLLLSFMLVRGDKEAIERALSNKLARENLTNSFKGELDPGTGLDCIFEPVPSVPRKGARLVSCVHSTVEVCHDTLATHFKHHRENLCSEQFTKICRITFRKLANKEYIEHCYTPMIKECKTREQEDRMKCKEVFETECVTKYEGQENSKHLGVTECRKVPVTLCANTACEVVEGSEKCHNKTITTITEVPEESCDLNPIKTCQGVYRLVPFLQPVNKCKEVPREVCTFGFKAPTTEEKKITRKWCYDPK